MLYPVLVLVVAIGAIAGIAYRRKTKTSADALKDARDLRASATREIDKLRD